MPIRFEIPEQLELSLRSRLGDLDRTAKEATLVDLFRSGLLSHFEFAEALGLNRFEADGVLQSHKVTEDLPSHDEQRAEADSLLKFLERRVR
jgi:hypothetical protein